MPMKESKSHFCSVRGLRYHVRTWGNPANRSLFMLHGWMDVSASFQFLVDALAHEWHVIAPDWRGFGLTEWSSAPYWFQDYYADLDAILDLYSPNAPVAMLAHSMGGNVACNFAGLRPERISHLVSLEGFGFQRMAAELAPRRLVRWLDEQKTPPRLRPYTSLDEVAERLQERNPRLTHDKAVFLASHWARKSEDGQYVLRADPKHKMANPVLNHMDENIASWKRISVAVLWVQGRLSSATSVTQDTPEQFAQRRAAFKNLRFEWLEGAGHMMHHDQPVQLARLVEPFLLT
jgi:pimeloyl-ACP methyl ester carboxylesterase